MMISLRSIFVLVCSAGIAISTAQAEYYLVYPGTLDPCYSCNNAQQYRYQQTWYVKCSHHTNRSSCCQSRKNCVVVNGCNKMICGGGYVKMRYTTPKHRHYVKLSNDPHDYDTTTADDNVMQDSDMNNQY